MLLGPIRSPGHQATGWVGTVRASPPELRRNRAVSATLRKRGGFCRDVFPHVAHGTGNICPAHRAALGVPAARSAWTAWGSASGGSSVALQRVQAAADSVPDSTGSARGYDGRRL